jgi:SAM-dependent methyltransferase/dienelactone hydrolase
VEGQARLQELPPDSLRRMHRRSIEDPTRVRALLLRLRDERVLLTSGVNHASTPRTATVAGVEPERLVLDAQSIECSGQPQIHFSFDLDGVPYFFAVPPLEGGGNEPLVVSMPLALYEAERRDLKRSPRVTGESAGARVELLDGGAGPTALVADSSYQGLGVVLPAPDAEGLADPVQLQLRFLDGERRGEEAFAEVKHRAAAPGRPGWVRLGLAVSRVPARTPVPVEDRETILEGEAPSRLWRRLDRGKSPSDERPPVRVVDYPNSQGQMLRAIVDGTGSSVGAPVVVIPPAWGKTKETLLALAQTLVQSFEQAGEPLVVVRFDGTNRRGESFIDPADRQPGREHMHFTFSQAVRDIRSTLDFFESSAEFESRRFLLVTYSLGAIEGRRAVASDERIGGWVSVVGMADLQSGLRAVSGGVDYAFGAMRGVEFGAHELVGVVADMDHTGRDALQNDLVFAEDARRDLAKISVPITWIHGRYDAWMDLTRVQEMLSAGDTSRRRLLQIATGHRLRSSREAFETFQLVTEEVSGMLIGRRLRSTALDAERLQLASIAETERLPPDPVDLRDFWHDYLLGRDRQFGIELMTSISAYQSLMKGQIELLDLRPGDLVVDLGSGTGDFPLVLKAGPDVPEGLTIVEVDYVRDALLRGRGRERGRESGRAACAGDAPTQVVQLCANLDGGRCTGIPLASGCADAAIASLLISYLSDPELLLAQVFDLLRPDGRLVLSSLRRDADISRIYVEGIAELLPDRVRDHFGEAAVADFEAMQRRFLNDAARLIDFEETGHFRFWNADELEDVVRKAGFTGVRSQAVFGDPPQAVVVVARRP